MSKFEIPAGLKELLQGYTVEVLRRRPANLAQFAVQHFTQVLESQRNEQATESHSTGPAEEEGDDAFETASNPSINFRLSLPTKAFQPNISNDHLVFSFFICPITYQPMK
uniref:U-box domain-containing protein n=1 Tax=Oryzias latipes TaxID=8090 RepID=A0A3P9M1Y8_ORYLA